MIVRGWVTKASVGVLRVFIACSLLLLTTACQVDNTLKGTIGSSNKPKLTITPPAELVEAQVGQVQFALNTPLSSELVIDYLSTSGTGAGGATNNVDYTAMAGQLTIAAGQTVAALNVVTLDDGVFEGAESFTISFDTPSTVSLAIATVTVVFEDDELPQVEFLTTLTNVNENVSPARVVLSVALEGAVSSVVTVNYATANGAATSGAGNDYTNTSGVLTIAAGQTIGSITIPILDDTTYEGNESFTVTLSAPSATALLGAQTTNTVTIVDNESQPAIQFAAATQQTNEAAGSSNIVISMTNASSQEVRVDYTATNTTATGGGVDYTLANATLTFAAGEISKTLSLSVNNDLIYEPSETFDITLSNEINATLGAISVQTHTIIDNETAPVINFTSATGSTNENAATGAVVINLSVEPSASITVNFTVANGTATGGGTDYTFSSGTATIAAGMTAFTFAPVIDDDALTEGAEDFAITLTGTGSGASLGSTTVHTHTINDNEGALTVSFASATANAVETVGAQDVVLTMTGASGASVVVSLLGSGTATLGAGSDYTLSATTLTFASGETSKTIVVTVNNDTLGEPDETVVLDINTVTGGGVTEGAQGTHTFTIDANDTPTVQYAATTSSVAEDIASPFEHNILVQLSGAASAAVTVDYAIAGSTTAGLGDYTLVAGTLTISAGSTIATITANIIDDSIFETPDEFVDLTLANPSAAATMGVNTAHRMTITEDDVAPEINFSAATATVAENIVAGEIVLSLSLSHAAASNVTVNYATSNGGGSNNAAASGSDYTSTSGTLTISSGATIGSITVPVLQDANYEGDEDFAVTLTTPSANAVLGATDVNVVTITDDESMPDIEWSAAAVTVLENVVATEVVLTVNLSGTTQAQVTINYASSNGGVNPDATSGSDYTVTSGVLTLAGGATTGSVTIPILDDGLNEGNEDFTMTLSSPSVNAALGATTVQVVTIDDDEGLPEINLAAATASVAENVAAGHVVLTVNLTGTSSSEITVNYATANGGVNPDASSGSDYTATSGTLTIAAMSLSGAITIPILQDTTFEGSEDFTFTLTSPNANATLGAADEAVVTITDDETAPQVSFASATDTVAENVGSGYKVLTVNLSGSVATAVTVNYSIADGGGANGTAESDTTTTPAYNNDYNDASGTITLAALSTSGSITVPIYNDGVYEGSEDFKVTLTGTSANASVNAAADEDVVTITDDESKPTLDLANATEIVLENVAGGNKVLTVNVTGTAQNAITVVYTATDGGGGNAAAESDGTAVAAKTNDYTDVTGTLTIAALGSSGTVTVPIFNDTTYEGDEDFTMTLSSPSTNALLGTTTVSVVTIDENDGQPVITFDLATDSSGEEDGSSNVVVELSNDSVQEVKVDYTVGSGTATGSGTDYTLAAGTLTFAAGETTKTLSVSFNNDTIDEADETFDVSLTALSAVNATVGVPGTQTHTILDNDTAPVINFASATGSTGENAGPGAVVVSLANASASAITVTYTTADGGGGNAAAQTGGSAAAGTDDYTFAAGTITIPALATSYTMAPAINDDGVAEGAEDFTISLTGTGAGASLGTTTVHVHTVNDNESAPTVYFVAATASASEGAAAQDVVLTMSGASASAVVVTLSVNGSSTAADGGSSALGTDDYTLSATTLTIAAGDTSKTFTLAIDDDTVGEPAETVVIDIATVTGGGVTEGAPGTHTFTINASDTPTVEFAALTSSQAEDATTKDVVIDLSNSASANVIVNYIIEGTTTATVADYTYAGGTVTFAAGELSKTLAVQILEDTIYETPDEFIDLKLDSITGTNATLGTDVTHRLTITDDDGEPNIDFASATYSVAENTPGNVVVTINLNHSATVSITVNFATSNGGGGNGTATSGAGNDYTTTSGTLTFAALSASGTVTIPVLDDLVYEGSEDFSITLSAPSSDANLGTTTVSVVTITENEADFDILGVIGTGDTTEDNILGGSTVNPTIKWEAATGAATYDVTVFETDGTTVKCALQNTASTQYNFSSCSLTEGTGYKAEVIAKNGGGSNVGYATNSQFSFTVNNKPTITTSGPWYVLSGGTINIDAQYAASPVVGTAQDADSDTLTFSAVGATTSTVGATTNNSTYVTYAANAHTGQDTFTFTVTDTKGGTVSGTMTVYVVTAFTWTGAAADNDWATDGNWCAAINANKTGCTNAGPEPTSSVTATHVASFVGGVCSPAANCNVTINSNANYTMYGMNLTSTYTGTFTQAATKAITIGAGGYTQSGGTFSGGNSQISVAKFNLVSGNFTAPSTDFIIANTGASSTIFSAAAAAIFNHGNSTLKFDNTNAASPTLTIDLPTSLTLNNLYVTNTAAASVIYVITTGDTFIVGGDFTMQRSGSGSTFVLNGGTINVDGNVIVGTNAYGGSTLIEMSGDSAQTYTGCSGCYLPKLKINTTGSVGPLATTDFAVSNFELAAGTFTAPTGTFTIYDKAPSSTTKFSVAAATTYNHNSGTLIFDHVSASSITLTIDLASSLEVSNLTYTNSGASNPVWEIATGDTLTVLGNFVMQRSGSGSAFTANGGAIEVKGDLTIGTNANGGTSAINLTGTGTQTINHSSGTPPQGTWTVNKASGKVTQASAVSLTGSAQDLNIVNGEWDQNNYALSLGNASGTDAVLTVGDGVGAASTAILRQGCATLTTESQSVNGTDGVIIGGAASPNISIADASVTEGAAGNAALNFVVTMDAPRCSDTTVNYATADNLATSASSDYTAVTTTTLTFASGELTKTITVNALGDSTPEGNETFYVNLSAPSAGTLLVGQATGTINNDDITGNVWTGGHATSFNASEPTNWADGTVPTPTEMVYYVPGGCSGLPKNGGPATTCDSTINVNLSQTSGGVVLGAGHTGTLTQGSGVAVTIGSNGYTQQGGTFAGSSTTGVITLSGPTTISGGTFTSTSDVYVTSSHLTISGGTFNHNNGTFRVNGATFSTLSTGSANLYNVEFTKNTSSVNRTISITGTVNVLGTLTLNRSSTSNAQILGGGEINAYGDVALTSTGVGGGGATTVLNIVGANNQSITGSGGYVPYLVINKTGNTATFTGTLGVERDVTYTAGLTDFSTSTFNFSSAVNSAINTSTMNFNNVQFIKDTSSNPRTITITGNMNILGDLVINKSGANAQPIDGGTIVLNGNLTQTSGSAGTAAIQLTGTGTQTITQTAGNLPQGTWTVNKASGKVVQATSVALDGTSTDLDIVNGEWDQNNYALSLGNASGTDAVLTVGDGVGATSTAILRQGCATLTTESQSVNGTDGVIIGGAASPNISIADASVTEGAAGNAALNFVVTMDAPRCSDTTVNYATADNLATSASSDYTAVTTTTLTFASGELTKTITVNALGDSTPEGNETFYVNLSAPSAGTLLVGQATGTINNDDITGNVWTGGDVANFDWSDGDNWQDGSAPGVGDIAYFVPGGCSGAVKGGGTTCDATINAATTVLGVVMGVGYTGTITQAASQTLTIGTSTTGFAQEGGTFTGGDSAITITGGAGPVFNLKGGTFTSTSGTLTVVNASNTAATIFNISTGATFNHNNGTLKFDSTASTTLTLTIDVPTSLTLKNLYYTNSDPTGTSLWTIAGSDALTLLGDFTMQSTGGGTTVGAMGGSINLMGNLIAGTNAGGGSTPVYIVGNTAQTYTSCLTCYMPMVYLNTTGSLAPAGGTTDFGAAFLIIVAGTFTAPTGTLAIRNLSGTDTTLFGVVPPAVFNHNGGTLMFDNISSSSIKASLYLYGSLTVNNLTYTNSSATGAINYELDSGSTFNVLGNFTQQRTGSGTSVTASAGTLDIKGNVTIGTNAAAGTAALSLTGTGTQNISQTTAGTGPAGLWSVNKASGSVVQTSALSLSASTTDLTIVNGEWDMAGYNLTVYEGADDDSNVLTVGDGVGAASTAKLYTGCGTLTAEATSTNPTDGALYTTTSGSTISIADATDVTEDDSTNQTQNFVVTVSPTNCAATTFNYITDDGSATAPSDYTAISSTTATIPAAQASITLTATTKFDNLAENNEYYTITLSSILAGVIEGDLVGVGDILDDDVTSAPTISINDPTAVTEGTNVSFVVTLSTASGQNVVFDWATADGTAKDLGTDPDDDYTAANGTVTILAGATTYTLPNIATRDDSNTESAENFTVTLSNVTNHTAAGSDLIGEATLDDNDSSSPTISVADISVVESDYAIFVVRLSSTSASNVVFDWTTTDGTATSAANDYVTASGTSLTIVAGQTSYTLPNIITKSDADAAGEYFDVTLSNVTNVAGAGNDLVGRATLSEAVAPATGIYRSMGYNKTTALAVGTSNGMTITSGVATFTNALPDNVGVGDALQYDVNNTGGIDAIAFIARRNSPTEYLVQNAAGANPTDTTGGSNTSWSIFRAYTTLSAAESGVNENASISAGVVNFDTFTTGANLTTLTKNWYIAIYADGVDTSTSTTTVAGWTTSATYRLTIYAPYLPTEVGISQRHNGVWDTTKATITRNVNNADSLYLNNSYVTVDGLQLSFDRMGTGNAIHAATTRSDIYVSNCIIRGEANIDSTQHLIRTAAANTKVWNNIFTMPTFAGTANIITAVTGATAFIYNNTIYGGTIGIYRSAGTVTAHNNIVQGTVGTAFSGTITGNNNVSDDASAPSSGSNNLTSNTSTAFVDATNLDYRLSTTDAVAKDTGADLSGDANLSFTTDIQRSTRPLNVIWDRGASEAGAASTNSLQMAALRYTNLNKQSFTIEVDVVGDANNNAIMALYYCNHTDSTGCDPLTGTYAGMMTKSGSTYSLGVNVSGSNDPGDFIAVKTVGYDVDGVIGNPRYGLFRMDLNYLAEIYRSMGYNKITALATGAGNGMTISGETATFASALPDNVGVGDAIQYDSDGNSSIDKIVFIHGRISSTQFKVRTNLGYAPLDLAVADENWSVYRAYTSLANAESGTENTAIDAAVVDFESWTAGNNLTLYNGLNRDWHIVYYADAIDSGAAGTLFDGWTTDANNRLRVFAPYLSTQVGVSQRHNGVWDPTKATFYRNPTTGNGIRIDDNYVTIEGLQIEVDKMGSGNYAVYVDLGATGVRVSNNIIRSDENMTGSGLVMVYSGAENVVWNNILTMTAYTGTPRHIYLYMTSDGTVVYNNTIHGGYDGIYRGSATNTKISNNIVQDTDGSAFLGAMNGNNNVSDDATAPTGSNNLTNTTTVAFADVTNRDFRLSAADSVAKDTGADLSADPSFAFNTDVVGVTRPSGAQWDRGAHESNSTGSNITTLTALRFTGVTQNQFTVEVDFEGDANANNDVDLYYCNDTDSADCNPINGTGPVAMSKSGNTYSVTVNASSPNDPGDFIAVKAVATDADGTAGNPKYAKVQIDLNFVEEIYRSVGFNNTTALTTGAGNGFTISGDTATFSTALPLNIGVGDALQYDSDGNNSIDNILFIYSRISSTQFKVKNYIGYAPVEMPAPDENWSIFRAYTTLQNAENGVENTAIDAAVRDFDTFTTGVNLTQVSGIDRSWHIAFYADAPDASAGTLTIDGWTTESAHRLKFFVPYLATHVGVSQRHSGTWDPTKARMKRYPSANHGILVDDINIEFEGFQFEFDQIGAGAYGIKVDAGADDCRFTQNIFRGDINLTSGALLATLGSNTQIWNNVFIYENGFTSTTVAAIYFSSGTGAYADNNTINGGYYGIRKGGTTGVDLFNNIVQGTTSDSYFGAMSGDNNISDDATAPTGSNNLTTSTVTFVDQANYDLRLSTADAVAKNTGVDLSGAAGLMFSDDILGVTRPIGGTWDRGAHEAGLTNNNITNLTQLRFVNVSQQQFTVEIDFDGDSNANNDVDLYYCNYTDSPDCDPMSGTGPVNMAKAGNTYSATLNLSTPHNPGDLIAVKAVALDSDGVLASPKYGLIKMDYNFTPEIYRSVGYNNTSALATGTGNGLTISGDTATFASALPTNIGVGDALQYDSDANGSIDTILFIHGRISSTQYKVKDKLGHSPLVLAAPDEDWSIFRAYTALQLADDGTENTGIDATVRDFDTWSGGHNISQLTGIARDWYIAYYADAVDTGTAGFLISGWTQDNNNRVTYFVPYLSTHVGVTQRHSGVWDTSKARIYRNPSAGNGMRIDNSYITFEGFQLEVDVLGAGNYAIFIDTARDYVSVGYNIIRANAGMTGGGLIDIESGTLNMIANNIMSFSTYTGTPSGIYLDTGSLNYIWSNTIVGGHYGIRRNTATSTSAQNNLIQNTANNAFQGGAILGDNNLSDDASIATGSNNMTSNTSVVFVDAANRDYRIRYDDTAAKGNGLLAIADDIAKITRVTADIGASTAIDSRPTINITPVTVTEGASVVAVVTLTGTYSSEIVFNWATDDGTAIDGVADPDDDYTSANGTATFTVGQTSITLPAIATRDDSDDEGSQYFTVNLSGFNGAHPGVIAGQMTLFDNDGSGPTLTATYASEPANPSNVTTLNVMVGGAGVVVYKSKVGVASTTDCTVTGGYSADTSVVTPVTTDVSSLGDVQLKLCLIGSDGLGNYQSYSTPTEYLWVKDATVPLLSGTVADGTYYDSVSQTPTLSWSAATDTGGTGIAYYELALGTSAGGADVLAYTNIGNVTSYQRTGLTLTSGVTYYAKIRAKDNVTNNSAEILSDGWMADAQAPADPTNFSDGSMYIGIDKSPVFTWTASTDAHSGIGGYFIAIGTTAGGTDVMNWTNIGNVTSYQATGLSLTVSTLYYASIKAIDNAGNNSSVVQGNGWRTLGVQKLVNTAPIQARIHSASAKFGNVLAISNDGLTFAVAAPADNKDANGGGYISDTGAVFIFVYSGGAWQFQQKIVGEGINGRLGLDEFAYSVALGGVTGDTLAVTARSQDYDATGGNFITNTGAVFIYTRSGSAWSLQQKVVGEGVNGRLLTDYFGTSVALGGANGDTLAVGTFAHDYDASGGGFVSGAGAVFVYSRSGGTWSLQQKVVGEGTNGRLAGDFFGTSIALGGANGDTLAVGATSHDYDAAGGSYDSDTGAVFVYTRSGSAWSFQQKVVGEGVNGRRSLDNFGNSVALGGSSGDTLVVGAQNQDYDATGGAYAAGAGAAFVYTRSGSTWSFQQKVVGEGTNGRLADDLFGNSVALGGSSGDTLVVGAHNQDYDATGGAYAAGAGAAFVYTRSGSTWSMQQKIVGEGTNGRLAGDYFGASVVLDGAIGDVLFVGANSQDYNAAGGSFVTDAGAAYLFEYGGSWVYQQKIVDAVMPKPGLNSNLSSPVSISADGLTMVVGASSDDTDASGDNLAVQAGAAFVYIFTGGSWQFQQKIVGEGVGGRRTFDIFGSSVALGGANGDTLAVGASDQDYDASGGGFVSDAGAVFVYTRSGSTWSLQQKIVGEGVNGRLAGDSFGRSVAFGGDNGDTLAVGALTQDYNATGGVYASSAGAVYVYTRSGSTWSFQQRIVGSGTNGRINADYFGNYVSLGGANGDTLAVGAQGQDYNTTGGGYASSAGAVYVYTRSGSTWSFQQKIVGEGTNGRLTDDFFGSIVALAGVSGDTLVVGAYGQDYDATGGGYLLDAGSVFVYTRSGSTWSLQQKIIGSGVNGRIAGDGFGTNLALGGASGDLLVVGARNQDYDINGDAYLLDAGAAFVFTRLGGTWSLQQKIVGEGTNGRIASDRFGTGVALGGSNGDTIAIGASGQDYDAAGANNVTNAGAVFVYH